LDYSLLGSFYRYNSVKGGLPEVLVSGSDDFTLIMWHPETEKKQVARLTGHQQLINEVTHEYLVIFRFEEPSNLEVHFGMTETRKEPIQDAMGVT